MNIRTVLFFVGVYRAHVLVLSVLLFVGSLHIRLGFYIYNSACKGDYYRMLYQHYGRQCRHV